LRDVGVNSRKLLQWILKKEDVRVWTDFIGQKIGISGKPIVETAMNFQAS
jgi:hypothetical protein